MPGQPPTVTQGILGAISGNNWYNYPFAHDYGGKEPYGNFPKPDINYQNIPANTPITSLTQGTVTNIDKISPWGYAVTVKMDSPYNAIATHAAYLHLTTVDQNLYVGKHIQEGDAIGTAGGNITGSGKQPAGLGFAFYNGDQYGYGPTWNQYVGSSQLDPTSFLSTFSSASPSTLNQANTIQNAQNASNDRNTPIVGPIICFIRNSALVVGFFLLGLVLIIIGFIILIHPNPETLVKGAMLA